MPLFLSGQIVSALLAGAFALPLAPQPPQPKAPAESAQQLARDVIWNELHDHDRSHRWEYLSTRTADGQTILREQVDTEKGPVFRILERNGSPLNSDQQRHEARRVADYIHNPSAVARIQHDHRQDQARLASIMRMIPQAFLFQYQGPPSGDIVRLSFRPDPAFVPSGYDGRIIHALAGTMTVNLRLKRMIDIRGTVSQPVNIGYGLLGYVDPGGTFEIHRRQVSATHWKTDLVDVHVRGRVLMLKNVAKNEREQRSDFQPVPVNVSLAQADQLLRQAAADHALQAQTASGSGGQQDASVTNPRIGSER